jgi:tetratricopeptide (TPR) repeat protein
MSCGGLSIDRKTDKSKNDVLESESLNRYGERKLSLIGNNPLNMALIKCHKGKIQEGLLNLKKYAIKEKDNSVYWQKVATCYYLDRKYSKSEFYNILGLKSATTKDRSAIHNNLGLIYLQKNHYEQAKQAFLKSLKLNKRFNTPRFNLAHLYIKFGLFSLALQELNYLIKHSPNDIEVIKSIAITQTQIGDYYKAINGFEKIPVDLRKRSDIAVYYAQALYLAGNLIEAKSVLFKKQSSLIPELRSMHNQLVSAVDRDLKRIKQIKK